MSRAFVKEDADAEGPKRFQLPAPGDAGYPLAAVRALLHGADQGDSLSAEEATGYRFGDPRLIQEARQLLAQAAERQDDRMMQLAERFLRKAGVRV